MDGARVGEFIDAAVHDQVKARAMLTAEPELLTARWRLGETALHFLAVEGYVDAVRFLAEAGAEIDPVNKFGDTPLVDVATLGNADVAGVLLEFGADPNARSEAHGNVLHAAVGSGNAELLRALLTAGARSDYATELGETIWDAIRPKHAERVERA